MLNINKNFLKSHKCYVGENRPKYIVMHETDNWSNGAGSNAHARAHFNGNLGSASVHYYVDDKEIYQTLKHEDGSWAVGDNRGYSDITNRNSINIELCVNPDSNYEVARDNAIELCAYLLKQQGFGIDRLKTHNNASGKHCPRKILDEGYWNTFKDKVSNILGSTVETTEVKPAENRPSGDDWIRRLQAECNNQSFSNQTVDGFAGPNTLSGCPMVRYGARGNITKLIQERLISLGYNVSCGADGIFGNGTRQAIMQFQRDNGLGADGIVGRNTWRALLGL